MSEEEKKKKFGDKYDPNYRGSNKHEKEAPDKGKDKSIEDRNIPQKNDWEFYALDEQIAKDVASIPYSYLTGVPVAVDTLYKGTNSYKTTSWKAKATMRIGYVLAQPSVGDVTEGINMAATQLYTFLRKVNSGAKNYEPADAIMYVLAMRDIYADFLELKRAIGISNYFSFVNRTVPRQLFAAMGIDYEDFISNVSNYRGALNIIAKNINSLAVPKYFKAFDRAAFIASAAFADSDSERGQNYIYCRDGYYTWDTTSSTSGTMLVYSPYAFTGGKYLTFKQRLDILSSNLKIVMEDTDSITISGDVLKAFASEQLYQLSMTDENYIVVPFMDEDALAQIENMVSVTAYGYKGKDMLNVSVTQSNGYPVWKPYFAGSESTVDFTPTGMDKFLFNSHKDDPDYKANLEWSRLRCVFKYVQVGSAYQLQLQSCGLELVTSLAIINDGTTIPQFSDMKQFLTPYNSKDDQAAIIQQVFAIQDFDWHPFIYFANADTLGNITAFYTCGDIKKYTWIDSDITKSINDSANSAAYYARDLYEFKRSNNA